MIVGCVGFAGSDLVEIPVSFLCKNVSAYMLIVSLGLVFKDLEGDRLFLFLYSVMMQQDQSYWSLLCLSS